MFRRNSSSLPPDPHFPADLEKLGYRINDRDQIRQIANPEQEFHYFISKNERVLEVQREAMDTCIREHLAPRFAALGLETTRLPLTAGPTDPHVPILTSSNLPRAKRLIIYFGESMQDLGVLAYRVIGKESIASGSLLDFVSAIQNDKDGADTAVVIANLGKLIWHRRGAKAMTRRNWDALPRKSGVDGPMRMDNVKNRVRGHETPKEHVARVFEMLEECARKDVAIDFIGVGEGAEAATAFLDEHWDAWRARVAAMAIGLRCDWILEDEVENEDFKQFWGKRARAYLLHGEPLDTPLPGRESIGCNCFSSGESTYTEVTMPRAFRSMLSFFQLVHTVPGYAEVPIEVKEDGVKSSDVVKWMAGQKEEANERVTFSVWGDPLSDEKA